jgi:poly-gamma-glutamate capsule biosynthesis protein CapA/YwtB (metallophosphatase superfamily)
MSTRAQSRTAEAKEQACERAHCTLFLCGDVMTGRGIDQILPHPCDPVLYEPYVQDARHYAELAQAAHGPISMPVSDRYLWGEALDVWDRVQPDVRIVNLETAITTSDRYWQGKEIHYRMSPQNMGSLQSAAIDCCVLANNHVLDWGYAGLSETLQALRRAGIQTVGAGENLAEAQTPAEFDLAAKGRVLVFSFGAVSGGIPTAWAAEVDRAGVNLLPDLSTKTVERISRLIAPHGRDLAVVIVSLHWGGNWGYTIPDEQRLFARQLIDDAGVDIVYGHSSHHVKAVEVYKNRLILYGCGDFLTDYEGIAGYHEFRGDLALMYFVTVDIASKQLISLRVEPLQVHRMQLRRASPGDAAWLQRVLSREGKSFGTRFIETDEHSLALQWDPCGAN